MDRLPTELKFLVVEEVATDREDDRDLHALALVNREFRDLTEAARWESVSFKTQSTDTLRAFCDDYLEKYGRRIATLYLDAKQPSDETGDRGEERAEPCLQVLAGVPNLVSLTLWAPSSTPFLPAPNTPAFSTLFGTSFGPSLTALALLGSHEDPLASPDVVALLAHFPNLTALECMNVARSPGGSTDFLTAVLGIAKLNDLRLIGVGDVSEAFLSAPSWSQRHLHTLHLAGFEGIVDTIYLVRFAALFADTLKDLVIELHDDPSNLPSHLSTPFPLRLPRITSFLTTFFSLQLLGAWIEIDKSPIPHLHIARRQEWDMDAAVLAVEERVYWAQFPPLVDLLSPRLEEPVIEVLPEEPERQRVLRSEEYGEVRRRCEARGVEMRVEAPVIM